MSKLKCLIGIHDFDMRHKAPWNLWDDFNVECRRGCGARKRYICIADRHWVEKHQEPDAD